MQATSTDVVPTTVSRLGTFNLSGRPPKVETIQALASSLEKNREVYVRGMVTVEPELVEFAGADGVVRTYQKWTLSENDGTRSISALHFIHAGPKGVGSEQWLTKSPNPKREVVVKGKVYEGKVFADCLIPGETANEIR